MPSAAMTAEVRHGRSRCNSEYYTLNIAYPKGPSGHCNNVCYFLEHLFLGKSPLIMPLGVSNVVISLPNP